MIMVALSAETSEGQPGGSGRLSGRVTKPETAWWVPVTLRSGHVGGAPLAVQPADPAANKNSASTKAQQARLSVAWLPLTRRLIQLRAGAPRWNATSFRKISASFRRRWSGAPLFSADGRMTQSVVAGLSGAAGQRDGPVIR